MKVFINKLMIKVFQCRPILCDGIRELAIKVNRQ